MPYAICRTDRLMGTRVESMLVSCRYQDGGADAAIENGNVVELKGLMASERELFVANAPTASSKLIDCVLVCTPEVLYDEHKKNLNQFINEAGSNCRGYRLHSGDVFSVTKEAIDGEAKVGNAVELMAGTKWKSVASATSGSTQVGSIIELDGDYVVILVA